MDVPIGCYIAGYLGYGQTSSLLFQEPGTYNYEVEFKAGGKMSGVVVVK
jgi:plastocyanin